VRSQCAVLARGGAEIPAHQNEGKSGDENGLEQCGERGSAKSAHHASLNIAGIGNNHDSTQIFSILENWKRINVQGGILNADKIAGGRADFYGTERFGRRLIESHGKPRSDGADGAGRIIDGDAAEAFTGNKPVEKMAESFGGDFVARGFDRLGDVSRDDRGAARLFIAQIPAFGAELDEGVAKRDARHADGQRQDKIESPSQFRSS